MPYDLAVVGAGPAGCACAFHAAKAGLKVVILEARRVPRQKLCSGVLTEYAEREARQILAEEEIARVSTGRFSETELDRGPIIAHRRLWLVDRPRFDAALLEAAARAGADVRTGVRVDPDAAATLDVALLVDATGSASIFGRRLQPRSTVYLGVETKVARGGPPDRCALDFRLPGGYWWAFPHGPDKAVGAATNRRELWNTFPGEVERYWKERGYVIDRRPEGHLLRRAWGSVAAEGVILVGEAAGALDQALGEGIRFALWTGRLAAESAAQAGPRGAPELYQRRFSREVRPLLTMRDVAAGVRDALPDLSQALLGGPLARVIIHHYLGDEAPGVRPVLDRIPTRDPKILDNPGARGRARTYNPLIKSWRKK